MSAETQSPLRNWRTSRKLSLEDVCERFAEKGFDKPSTAKLSRIEREQDVPPEMVPAIEAITGIPAKELRPDLAKLFLKEKSQ